MQMTTAAETPDGEALNFDNTSMVTDISITRSVLVACLSSDGDADGCSGGKTRRVAGREKPMLDAECKICGFKGRTTCKDRIRIKCGGSCKDQHDQWKICNDRPTKRLRPATPPANTPLSLAPSTPQLQSQPLPATTPIKAIDLLHLEVPAVPPPPEQCVEVPPVLPMPPQQQPPAPPRPRYQSVPPLREWKLGGDNMSFPDQYVIDLTVSDANGQPLVKAYYAYHNNRQIISYFSKAALNGNTDDCNFYAKARVN